MNETLKLALEALEYWDVHGGLHQPTEEAITAIKTALTQPTSGDYALGYAEGFNDACKPKPAQEPVAWHLIEALYPQGERLDIRMGDGSILCDLLPQADGDLWWEGSGTGEKFIDPVYADVTHWRIHSNTTPPAAQPEERNFCPRCGKRTADLTVIHTCTPPQENT
jgi:hypothetical protein